MTLTAQDKQRLRGIGVRTCFEISPDEWLVEKCGIQYRDSTAHLKRIVRPTLLDRLRHLLAGVSL